MWSIIQLRRDRFVDGTFGRGDARLDQDGTVIDIPVQPRRDQRAAERFFRRLLRGQEKEPFCIITDKLRSYSAAMRTILCDVAHSTERYPNNRAEASH